MFRDGAFIVISGAGNGWGKSELIIAIFAAAMWPHLAPPCLAGSLFQNWKYPKRARIYSNPAELEQIGSLQTAIKKLFPKNKYEASKGKYSYPSIFKTDTDWVLDLFSYERDEGEAAGPNIGLQAFNEPPPAPLWKEGVARARAGGIIIGGMTSLYDNPWVADGLLFNANGADVRVRFGGAEENCKQHGKNGHLEHDQIEKILSQYDPDERESRLTGKPLSFSGRIYKPFDRTIHVAKESIKPPEICTVFQSVDPAIGKPLAAVYGFVDRSQTLNIFKEWPEQSFEGMKDSNMGVREYADLFKSLESGFKVETRILDRHFGNVRRTLGGSTLKEQFAEVGIDFIDSYSVGADIPEVETGIYAVKDYLAYDKALKPYEGTNGPRIRISPDCKNTIASFEKWSRDPDTGKPKYEYKDFADCVRYLIMSQPSWEPPKSWGQAKQPYFGVNV